MEQAFKEEGKMKVVRNDFSSVSHEKISSFTRSDGSALFMTENSNCTWDDGVHKYSFKVFNFVCEVCQLEFKSMLLLEKHMKSHEKHKPYECLTCSEAFSSTIDLISHIEIHEVPKIFMCGLCNSSFYDNSLLVDHIEKLHQEIPCLYKCSECQLPFKELSQLKSHVSDFHRISVDSDKHLDPVQRKEFGDSHVTDGKSQFGYETRKDQYSEMIISKDKECEQKGENKMEIKHNFICSPSVNNMSDCISDDELNSKDDSFEAKEVITSDVVGRVHVTGSEENVISNQIHTPEVCKTAEDMGNSDISKYTLKYQTHPTGTYAVDCTVCKSTFDSLVLLENHRSETKCECFKCDLCHKHFLLETELVRHKYKVHISKQQTSYSCPVCGTSFATSSRMADHAIRHVKSKVFLCKLCNKRFLTIKDLYYHILRHDAKNDVSKHDVKNDGEKSVSSRIMKLSLNLISKSDEENDKNEHQMGGIIELVEHDIEGDTKNTENDKRKQGLSDLEGEKTNEKKQGRKSKICPICHKSTLRLAEHIDRHTLPYLCNFCGKSFPSNFVLQAHINTKHAKDSPYKCDICNRSCGTATSLKNHKLCHTSGKDFECVVCSKKFTQQRYLDSHVKIHNNEKRFQCHMCSFTCKHKCSLQKHIGRHENGLPKQKTIPCPQCGKMFSCNTFMKIHLRTHFKIKPYDCDICGQSFSRFSYLKIHNRIHTGEKPYKCPVCSHAFAASCNKNAHVRKVHPDYISN